MNYLRQRDGMKIRSYQLGGVLAIILGVVSILLFADESSILQSMFSIFSFSNSLTHLLAWILPGLVVALVMGSIGKGVSVVFWASFYLFIVLYGNALISGVVQLPYTLEGEFSFIQGYLYPLVANSILGGVGGAIGSIGRKGYENAVGDDESYDLAAKNSKLPVTCPHCDTKVFSSSVHCSHCGRRLCEQ